MVAEPGSVRILGATGVHRWGPPHAVEIGYWIRTDATRQGLATFASHALTTVTFARLPDITTVEIRMDSLNVRSAANPPKLGFRLQCEVDQPVDLRVSPVGDWSGRWLGPTGPRATAEEVQAGNSACHQGTGRSKRLASATSSANASSMPEASTATSGTRSQQPWIPTWTVAR